MWSYLAMIIHVVEKALEAGVDVRSGVAFVEKADDGTTWLLGGPQGDRKAKADSIALASGLVGLQHPRSSLARDAGTIVIDPDLDPLSIQQSSSHLDPAVGGHGITGVDQQIEDDPLKIVQACHHFDVGARLGDGREIGVEMKTLRHQSPGTLDDLLQLHQDVVGKRITRGTKGLLKPITESLRLLQGLGDLVQLGDAPRIRGPGPEKLETPQYREQHSVEIMGNAPGELGDRLGA